MRGRAWACLALTSFTVEITAEQENAPRPSRNRSLAAPPDQSILLRICPDLRLLRLNVSLPPGPAPPPPPCRHVMFDVLVPLFNMQHLFGVYTPDAQPLILRAMNGTEADLRARLPRLINTPRPEMSLLRLAWRHDDEWAGEYAARLLGAPPGAPLQGLVCFKVRRPAVCCWVQLDGRVADSFGRNPWPAPSNRTECADHLPPSQVWQSTQAARCST